MMIERFQSKSEWGEQDSNLRRRSQRSYSPSQLATLVSPRLQFFKELCFLIADANIGALVEYTRGTRDFFSKKSFFLCKCLIY